MAIFGVDFGTTNTAVAVLGYGKTTPEFIYRAEDGERPFPSLVALHPELPPQFGMDVKKRRGQLIEQGYRVISSFKSILGKPGRVIVVGDHKYTPVEVTALFLSYVKEQTALRCDEPLEEAVFACPVDFQPTQREELREAAARAGIHIRAFVNEPTAAFLYRQPRLAGCSRVVVFDWGGGTLDISLMRIENKMISEIAKGGIQLGGDDMDEMLARHIHARYVPDISYDTLTPKDMDQALERAEIAKMSLTTNDEVTTRYHAYAGVPDFRAKLTLEEFNDLIGPLVDQAESILHDTLEKGGMSIGQLDALVLVGGSSEIQLVEQKFGTLSLFSHLRVDHAPEAKWAIAAGAAMLAARDVTMRLQDAFGVQLSDGSFYPLLEAGTPVPCQLPDVSFGVVQDDHTANFIFTDSRGTLLRRASVPIKGFTAEGIRLSGFVDENLVAQIEIHSDYADRLGIHTQINQLRFSYAVE